MYNNDITVNPELADTFLNVIIIVCRLSTIMFRTIVYYIYFRYTIDTFYGIVDNSDKFEISGLIVILIIPNKKTMVYRYIELKSVLPVLTVGPWQWRIQGGASLSLRMTFFFL